MATCPVGDPKFATWRFIDAVSVRVEQFRTPYSRAFITPLTNSELPTRGLVFDHFGLGRDAGTTASGDVAGNRFHYDLAVVNGTTINELGGDRDAPAIMLSNRDGVSLHAGLATYKRATEPPLSSNTAALIRRLGSWRLFRISDAMRLV
jgi:hypothetical protein